MLSPNELHHMFCIKKREEKVPKMVHDSEKGLYFFSCVDLGKSLKEPMPQFLSGK